MHDQPIRRDKERLVPSPEVVRVRKMLGVNTEHTNEDYQAICDRMAAKVEADEAAAPEPLPAIGDGLPPGCPIIPTSSLATEPATWAGRSYTVEEMNRATLEHRNREQARFVEIFRVRHARELLTAQKAKAKPEPLAVRERIIEAITGADAPLSGSAIARVLGGKKATVLSALTELLEAGRLERSSGTRGAYLWAVPTVLDGSQDGTVPPSSSLPPTGVRGTSHGVTGNHTALSPTIPEPVSEEAMKVVTIQGTNTQEKAASIVELLKAGEIEAEDFAVLLKREVPEFVEAYKIAVGQ